MEIYDKNDENKSNSDRNAEKYYSSEPKINPKTFDQALAMFFKNNFPNIVSDIMIKPLIDNIKNIFEKYYPKTDRLKPGQFVWVGVDREEKLSYGKSLSKTKMVPAVFDVITDSEFFSLISKEKKAREIKKEIVARLFSQAYEQNACLTLHDVSVITRLSSSTLSKYIKEYENENNKIVQRRGVVHDIGRSTTHKKIILQKLLLEKKTFEQTSFETNHSIEAIRKYYLDFKRIFSCLEKNFSVNETAFAVKVSENLVLEYISLIEHFKNNNSKSNENNFNIPF